MTQSKAYETYKIGNNTDMRPPFQTNNRRAAARVWRTVQPGAAAGGLYSAWFVARCRACGGWQDMTVLHITCDCRGGA